MNSNNTIIEYLIDKRINGEQGCFNHIAAFIPKVGKYKQCLKCCFR